MLVVLSGVSGAGKDTIKKALIARMDNVESLPSYTDRLPREGEKNGEIYNFVSKEEFENMIANNEFYEYNVHHEHYYGTSRKLMNEKIKSGKVIVKDIDVNGTANLIKLLGNDTRVVTIFLKVPKEVLAKRLEKRMEKPDYKEITLRLNRFDYEESKMGMYDYVIKNNDLEKSINVIMEIIKSELKIENPEF
ncbi:guanylate kinase [Clostridium sp. CAG:492]|jgi:guanylate kinase|nr:guanylate kinase [Clostridium sp. CAG:492]